MVFFLLLLVLRDDTPLTAWLGFARKCAVFRMVFFLGLSRDDTPLTAWLGFALRCTVFEMVFSLGSDCFVLRSVGTKNQKYYRQGR